MKKVNTINCALITMAPFPIGNVSTLRYTSYLKSLLEQGVITYVYIISPSYMARYNTNKSGIYNGINYHYMTKISWKKQTHILIKLYYYIIGLLKSVYYLRKNKINIVILYHQEAFAYYFYWIILKILSIAYITDKSEYPYGFSKMTSWRKKIEYMKLKIFDGFIIMTNELVTFYSKHKSSNAKIFHLPMTIDLNRYKNSQIEKQTFPYIAVVFGIHNRDGLYESVIAYNYYKKMAKDTAYKLVLIGNYQRLTEWENIYKYIKSNNLQSFIDIKGEIPIDKVPQIIINAKCLLTTPNEYTSGGFPTKLGEYLLSGVPVVATYAGEINLYLKNGKHALLSKPKDYTDIAKNIYKLQKDPILASQISEEAQKLVYSVFNADTYSLSLINFFTSIIKHNQ